MADLVSALVKASKAFADPIVSSYASGNRTYQVRITRPGDDPTYDRATGEFSNPDDVLVYEGPARIWPITGSAQVTAGDEVEDISQVHISIDDTALLPPRLEDLVTVLVDEASQAGHVADRQYTVADVQVGGHFSYGWHLTGSGVAPSRRTV
jgi:hypothetical protein